LADNGNKDTQGNNCRLCFHHGFHAGVLSRIIKR
jgi:hypothetical protein